MWTGPFQVLECQNYYLFVIESVLEGSKEEFYGRRFTETNYSKSLRILKRILILRKPNFGHIFFPRYTQTESSSRDSF